MNERIRHIVVALRTLMELLAVLLLWFMVGFACWLLMVLLKMLE